MHVKLFNHTKHDELQRQIRYLVKQRGIARIFMGGIEADKLYS